MRDHLLTTPWRNINISAHFLGWWHHLHFEIGAIVLRPKLVEVFWITRITLSSYTSMTNVVENLYMIHFAIAWTCNIYWQLTKPKTQTHKRRFGGSVNLLEWLFQSRYLEYEVHICSSVPTPIQLFGNAYSFRQANLCRAVSELVHTACSSTNKEEHTGADSINDTTTRYTGDWCRVQTLPWELVLIVATPSQFVNTKGFAFFPLLYDER